MKIKNSELREFLRQEFGGSVLGDHYVISHKKSIKFLGIIKDYLSVHTEKVELILKIYSHGFSGKYKKEYKEQIYKEFKRLKDGDRKRV